jgi:hypothetical protein
MRPCPPTHLLICHQPIREDLPRALPILVQARNGDDDRRRIIVNVAQAHRAGPARGIDRSLGIDVTPAGVKE